MVVFEHSNVHVQASLIRSSVWATRPLSRRVMPLPEQGSWACVRRCAPTQFSAPVALVAAAGSRTSSAAGAAVGAGDAAAAAVSRRRHAQLATSTSSVRGSVAAATVLLRPPPPLPAARACRRAPKGGGRMGETVPTQGSPTTPTPVWAPPEQFQRRATTQKFTAPRARARCGGFPTNSGPEKTSASGSEALSLPIHHVIRPVDVRHPTRRTPFRRAHIYVCSLFQKGKSLLRPKLFSPGDFLNQGCPFTLTIGIAHPWP